MKKALFLMLGSLGVFGILGCGWSAVGVMKTVLNGNLGEHKLFNWCTSGLIDLDRLLDNKTYYVMLENNTELRATGGFMGSYAKIETDKKGIKQISVQDIYVPDGQLPGHVEPPYPVQEAFKIGYWWLRDSNWDPDFASAAADTAWFLEQGGEPPADGILAVNQLTVSQLISVFGELEVSEFDKTVTGGNLYSFAQRYAEEGFFPGSTKKKDFLGAVGGALVRRVKDVGWIELGKMGKLVWDELDKKQILIWMRDSEIQKWMEKAGWGGRLGEPVGDYLYIVESNLGANKANCCIKRSVDQWVSGSVVKTQITWENENEFDATKPPVFLGGQYVNYNRVVIPSSHKLQSVKVQGRELRRATEEDFKIPNSLRQEMSVDMYNVEQRGDLQIVGFWANVKAKETVRAELQYLTPDPSPNLGEGNQYKILVKRQPGIEGFWYKLIYNGKLVFSGWIDKDKTIWIK